MTLITEDSIDFYITKQLVHVMYVLTERAAHEHVLSGDEESHHTTIFNIIDATEKLLKVNA